MKISRLAIKHIWEEMQLVMCFKYVLLLEGKQKDMWKVHSKNISEAILNFLFLQKTY